MIKKVISLLICLVMGIGMTACNNSAESGQSSMLSSEQSASDISSNDVESELSTTTISSAEGSSSSTTSSREKTSSTKSSNQNSKSSVNTNTSTNTSSKADVSTSYTRLGMMGMDPINQGTDISDEEWAMYKKMGVKRLRFTIQWAKTGKDEENPDYFLYDETIERAKKEGVSVLINICYETVNSFKTTTGDWGQAIYPDPTDKMVYQARKIIQHFSKLGVTDYEIWNEPNGMWNVNPDDYARMISTIYEKCKYTEKWADDKKVNLCAFALDSGNLGSAEGVNSGARQFIRNVYVSSYYKNFKKKYGHSPFDAVSMHPYNTIVVDSNGNMTSNMVKSAIEKTVLNTMKNYGDEKLPIWITEMGSNLENDTQQAGVVYNAIIELSKIPQVQYVYWFKMQYDNWGLTKYPLTPRPAVDKFAQAVKVIEGR